jgi:hypothetical protein
MPILRSPCSLCGFEVKIETHPRIPGSHIIHKMYGNSKFEGRIEQDPEEISHHGAVNLVLESG